MGSPRPQLRRSGGRCTPGREGTPIKTWLKWATVRPAGTAAVRKARVDAAKSTPPSADAAPADDHGDWLRSTAAARRLGDFLTKEGLVTEAKLEEAMRIQASLETYKPLGQILVGHGAITQRQLNYVLELYQKRSRLGDLLVRARAITPAQLEAALESHRKTGLPLGETFLQLRMLSEEAMRQALCMQLNILYVDLDECVIDRSLAALLSKSYARRHAVVPIAKIGTALTLAMDDPSDLAVVEEVQSYTGCAVSVVTSTSAKIHRAYAGLFDEAPPEPGTPDATALTVEVEKAAGDAVRRLIAMAIRNRASDIHIESLDGGLRIRFRIDGVLQDLDLRSLEHSMAAVRKEIVSRIKILAKMELAERRRPEKDGDVSPDFRVSIIPRYHGENVVLRVLDSRNAPKAIEQIGFSPALTHRLRELLGQPAGIVLVTGPTGSGKSTTLYGTLMTLHRPGVRILTAEDQVDYVYEQCIGNTFTAYLRSSLRHDPEVTVIGEINDLETAEMAFHAAHTGHLVLTTLPANDAVSGVMRLLDMGVEPNLITASLLGVLSQRLVREICTACREAYEPPAELLRELFDVPPAEILWYRGLGCTRCNFTGYSGRIAVAELWTPGDADFLLITKRVPLSELREAARASTITMAEDVSEKLVQGRTTVDELIRSFPHSGLNDMRRLSCFVAP